MILHYFNMTNNLTINVIIRTIYTNILAARINPPAGILFFNENCIEYLDPSSLGVDSPLRSDFATA